MPGTQLMFRGGFEYQTGTLDENGDPETYKVVGDINDLPLFDDALYLASITGLFVATIMLL